MAPADLRRFDADQAIIVATDDRNAIGQLESRRGASAAHDLEYIVHRGFVPNTLHVGSHFSRRNDRTLCKLSFGGRVRKWKAGIKWRVFRAFPKTTCIPGPPRYTDFDEAGKPEFRLVWFGASLGLVIDMRE